jgi:uncharacterized protein (DUF1919 family)
MSRLNYWFRRIANVVRKSRLKNAEATIFSSNCIGGCISHDLNMKFQSPFVNLWIESPDYIRLLESPKEYLAQELVFIKQDEYPFPVAMLGDIKLFFAHYHSEKEAEEIWKRRCRRIDWDNLFIMMTDRDGCNEEILHRFDKLPYKHKIVFTHIPRPDIVSSAYIPGFENETQLGDCVEFVNSWSGKRYYDCFNYVKWLNEG